MKTNPMAGLLSDMMCVKLVTEDKIFTNNDFAKFSLYPIDGFRLWSSYMENEFRGYRLLDNEDMTLYPETAPTQSYEKLMSMLKNPHWEDSEEVK